MIPEPKIGALAQEMIARRTAVRQGEPLTALHPGFDMPSAYEVALAMHEARIAEGAVPVGRKIGFTNFEMWKLFGVAEPIWAHTYDRTVSRLDPAGTSCSLAPFAEPRIEPEIAFAFRSAPPPGADPAVLLECIEWAALAFEIVQSHYPGWRFQAADTVADGSLHGHLYLGEPVPVARIAPDPVAALASFTLALACDGEVREVGRGANVLGSPLSAVGHLVNLLARQPRFRPLAAGEIVTTGTITTARAVRPGEAWTTRIEALALPDIALRFLP